MPSGTKTVSWDAETNQRLLHGIIRLGLMPSFTDEQLQAIADYVQPGLNKKYIKDHFARTRSRMDKKDGPPALMVSSGATDSGSTNSSSVKTAKRSSARGASEESAQKRTKREVPSELAKSEDLDEGSDSPEDERLLRPDIARTIAAFDPDAYQKASQEHRGSFGSFIAAEVSSSPAVWPTSNQSIEVSNDSMQHGEASGNTNVAWEGQRDLEAEEADCETDDEEDVIRTYERFG